MTAGAPLYLVSACTSGEEFVAAFRRYADRNGVLFIPTAEPLTSGKRGRIAVTLKDGGVMLEGEAEVVSSSKNPSVLYGRVGMTIKFTGPDELSKVVLGDLEKARLSLKPSAPSVMPRPTELPSSKRPTPPVPGGRIDAVNALAECAILGELAEAVPAVAAGVGSGRFAVPQILPLGGRPKSTTTPPIGREKTLTQPPLPAPIPAPMPPAESTRTKTASIPPAIPGLPESKATSIGMPAIRTPAFPVTPPSTMHGLPQNERPPAAPLIAPPPPIIETPTAIEPLPSPPPKLDVNDSLLGTLPGTLAPPIVATARPAMPEVEIGEPTDLHVMPPMLEGAPTEQSDAQPEPRTTNIGVAVGLARMPAVIEEPTPSGDWTITPGENGPTITRSPRPEAGAKGPPTGDWLIALDPSRPDGWSEPSKVDAKAFPEQPGPPVSTVSGNVLNAAANLHQPVVPQTGPSIEIDPSLTGPLTAMPDVSAHAVAAASLPHGSFVAPLLTPTTTPAVQISPEQHLAMLGIAPAEPRGLTDAGTGFFRDSGEIQRYPTEPTYAGGGSRKHLLVIGASAAAAVLLGLALVFAFGGEDKKTESPATTAGSSTTGVSAGSAAPPAAVGSSAPAAVGSNVPAAGSNAIAEAAPETKPEEVVTPPPDPVVEEKPAVVRSDGACEVKVTSAPAGAAIQVGSETVGKTPTTITLPCGVEAKLSLRKPRYVNANVTVKPSAEKPRPVKVALARVTMTVKVSSVPAGATITVGAKSMGVTPTTVKLPAFEPSALKISKPGFTPVTHKVTPKQNNVSVHAVLKKAAKR